MHFSSRWKLRYDLPNVGDLQPCTLFTVCVAFSTEESQVLVLVDSK